MYNTFPIELHRACSIFGVQNPLSFRSIGASLDFEQIDSLHTANKGLPVISQDDRDLIEDLL